jgi:hypothetical protein
MAGNGFKLAQSLILNFTINIPPTPVPGQRFARAKPLSYPIWQFITIARARRLRFLP